MTPNKTKEKDRHMFGVCVNILHETWDFSKHLVEWLEMLRDFGVARVLVYTLQVTHPILYLALGDVLSHVSQVLALYAKT